jgi:hypothetical protein
MWTVAGGPSAVRFWLKKATFTSFPAAKSVNATATRQLAFHVREAWPSETRSPRVDGVTGGRPRLGLFHPVPAALQRWGEVLLEVDADHWAQVGWSDAGDVVTLYDHVVRELRARGL